ncbi:hypothetical protein GCM10007886_09370 [Methylobacterium gregans]|uniref:Uncharacterized protein n=1 Tax=Methylobacterium gregans TaxID=374424 RepID=A0AA37HQC8_9HYPH|nr:hypothetical protein [Methylobacterium gregans]GJD79700.1 hypothetical protein NBEOAGPD_2929 [Methylobacterium gregans]GLS52754.1 hypothetical protein GCM10007886_09370 [Methylobacterium gregans]
MIQMSKGLRLSPSPLCGGGWAGRKAGSGEGNPVSEVGAASIPRSILYRCSSFARLGPGPRCFAGYPPPQWGEGRRALGQE